MPNGYYGSIEEWQKMEAPLLEIDALLAEFALRSNMQVIKNYHNWPQRELQSAKDGLHRTIHILVADKPETYHMAIGAWQDKDNERYVANKWLRKWVSWSEIQDNLHQLLEEGVKTLESWSEKDLKPAYPKSE
jgi:hypothetical protein